MAKLKTIPASYKGMYRDLYKKAWSKQSRKAAVRAFCLECVCYQEAEVRRCTSPGCPLFEFRLKG